MFEHLLAGMMVLLSVGIVFALSYSLATDNEIEPGFKNGTALSSRKGTESLLQLHINKNDNLNMEYYSF